MNTYQETRLKMYVVVRDFILKYLTILQQLPSFNELFQTFCETITKIQEIGKQQEMDKTGVAEDKKVLKQTVIDLTIDASRKLVAYAKLNNNNALLNEVRFSESSLKQASETELSNIAQNIYNSGNTYLNDLAQYGTTAETQEALQTAITAFHDAIPKTRLEVVEGKQYTTQLKALYDIEEGILEKIDILIEIIRNSQSEFYNGYRSVRKVINTGRSYISLKGLVTDAHDNMPLKSVEISISLATGNNGQNGQSKNGQIIKTTAEKGGFMVKSIDSGTYAIIASKQGYKDQTMMVNVNDGEMTTVNIALERN